MGLKKSKFEFSLAGTLYSSSGPKFTNRDPDYSGSYVNRAYSFNGIVSYYTKTTKTSLGFREYNTPMGWGTYANSPTTYLGLPSQGYNNVGTIGILARNIRGEKSGLDDPFLRTFFIQNDFKPNEKFNLLTRVVYRETGNADDSYIYVTTDGTKLIRAIVATYSNRISGEISSNYALAKNQKISAGIEVYQDNVEAGSRGTTVDLNTIYLLDGRDTLLNLYSTFLPRKFDIRNNFGSYAQYVLNTNILGKTNFTVGGRYDYNSYFGSAVSPRVAIVNQLNDKLTLKFQFGTAFRAPTNLEIYQANAGNFQLKKEKIKTYELNAIYVFSKNIRAQVNLFRNELSDVIVIGSLSGLNPNKNPGVQTTNGAEAVVDMIFSNKISGFLNFTYQDATGENLVTNYKGPIPGVAKVKGNAGLTAHVEDLFTVSLIGNWIGTRQSPRTDPYGPVAGYFLTNCVLSTGKLFNTGIVASINVQNIFNTKWMDPGFRTADGLLYSTVLEQPGINVLFKVGINF